MGERGKEGVARPGEKGNGERGGRKGLSALHSQSQYRISSAHNIKHDTLEYVQAIQLTTSIATRLYYHIIYIKTQTQTYCIYKSVSVLMMY